MLRFSGTDNKGAKSTIEFWNMESLGGAAFVDTHACRLGVLSYRAIETIDRKGGVLYVSPTKMVSDHLHVQEDADFLAHGDLSVLPGVACDRLLTSTALFGATELDRCQSAIISKWLKLSGCSSTPGSCCSSVQLPGEYQGIMDRMRGRANGLETQPFTGNTPALKPAVATWIVDETVNILRQNSYSQICFIGDPQTKGPQHSPSISEKTHPHSFSVDDTVLEACPKEYISSPFSSNCLSFYAKVVTIIHVFVKTGPWVSEESKVLPLLEAHFPRSMLQNILDFNPDTNRMVCEKYPGTTLNDIRLAYHNTKNDMECDKVVFCRLVNIELARAKQVTRVILNTIRPCDSPSEKQLIHRFYHGRLHMDRQATAFYGTEAPEFFHTDQNKRLTLQEFMMLPIIINGQRLGSLSQCCRRAEGILDPAGQYLCNSSVAVGFGDGHGGNVMTTHEPDGGIRFIDYEVSGWHSPVLDMAKPLYNDALFSVLYRELLSKGGSDVEHKVTDEAIIVNIKIRFSLLDRTVAYIKLEHMLHPLLERLKSQFPNDFIYAEDVLAAGMFTCAFLTRNLSAHRDVFFLNVAVGVLLLTDIKGTLSQFFGWSHWPSIVHGAALVGGGGDNLSRVVTKSNTTHVDFKQFDISTLSKLLRELEPEMVYLKRVKATLKLHGESSSKENNVIARIGVVRKLAMQVGDHIQINLKCAKDNCRSRHTLASEKASLRSLESITTFNTKTSQIHPRSSLSTLWTLAVAWALTFAN